jgi:hypothetical protein
MATMRDEKYESRSLYKLISLITPRSEFMTKARSIFTSHSRVTWIEVGELSYPATSLLVSRTLHRSEDDCAPLSQLLHSAAHGNTFTVRNLLATLYRQHHVRLCIFLVLMIRHLHCDSSCTTPNSTVGRKLRLASYL